MWCGSGLHLPGGQVACANYQRPNLLETSPPRAAPIAAAGNDIDCTGHCVCYFVPLPDTKVGTASALRSNILLGRTRTNAINAIDNSNTAFLAAEAWVGLGLQVADVFVACVLSFAPAPAAQACHL